MSEKNKLAEKLLYAPKNGYDRLSAEEEKAMNAYCEDYKEFLNHGKTERLCVEYCIELAEKKGFMAYEAGMRLAAGDKVYFNNRGKGIMLAVIGSEDLSHGANIGAAHTDAPRLDLKPRPLYEEAEMAYFKTHHYGGIRKYQWVTIPLELHGVAVLRDGKSVAIHIGGEEGDPQFIINDLLPHLGREQGKKPYIIPGGASNCIGALGYVNCAQETMQQLFDMGLKIDHIVVPSGSAGTHAGMIAGMVGNNVDIPVSGVDVSRPRDVQEGIVRKLAQETLDYIGAGVKLPGQSVTCFDAYYQPGYSLPNDGMVEAVKLLARTEAILLDPVYSGKAMSGMIDLIRKDHFPRGANVLFLHTGGSPALYAYLPTFRD